VTSGSAKQTAYLNSGVLHSLDAMKNYPIIVDPEFRALISPMSAEERAVLLECATKPIELTELNQEDKKWGT
jgi:hypothetical protein